MKTPIKLSLKRTLPVAVMAAALVTTGTLRAQTADAPKADPALVKQIAQMKAKAGQLQGALAQNNPKKPPMGQMPATSPAPGMSPGMSPGGGMGMGMDKMDKSKMAGAPMAPASAAPMSGGMGMDMDKDEMSGMGAMMGMDKMEMAGMMGSMSGGAGAMAPSALPGFAGASHLYHVGATDFFLDHPTHITLTTEQQVNLSKMREAAALAKTAADRKIEQAEQELWTLTASDAPDIMKVDAKIREVEKLSGDSRVAFIKAVGDAAKILTDDQRKILSGFMAPQPAMAPAAAAPMAPAASPAMTPMSDM